MANTFQNAEAFADVLQWVLRENFVWENIVTYKFENEFAGAKEVHFFTLNKTTTEDLATSYSTFTPQDLVEWDETFTLTTRKVWSVQISDEDMKALNIDPTGRAVNDAGEAFGKDYDTAVMGQYASAGYIIDAEAVWGAAGDGAVLTKDNIYDFITEISQKMDESNIGDNNRWLVIAPKHKKLLKQHLENKATALWDAVFGTGYYGMVDEFMIYVSNNLTTETTNIHGLAWNGTPINFAALIRPNVTFVSSETQANNFVNTLKAQTFFGVKTFNEWAIELLDLKIDNQQ